MSGVKLEYNFLHHMQFHSSIRNDGFLPSSEDGCGCVQLMHAQACGKLMYDALAYLNPP